MFATSSTSNSREVLFLRDVYYICCCIELAERLVKEGSTIVITWNYNKRKTCLREVYYI